MPPPASAAADGFDAFFDREYPRAVKLAWLLTGSAAAEDVAAEAMLAAYRRFGELHTPQGYLTRAVVNGCHNWHRRRHRDLRLVQSLQAGTTSNPDVALNAGEQYLLDAIHALPYRQRVAIIARYWADWDEATIAAALNCRPGTVKSLTSRALDRLRTEIQP